MSIKEGCYRASPKLQLLYFICLNFFICVEGACFALSIPILISEDGLNISNTEADLLGTVQTFGYILTAPLYSQLSKFIHPLFTIQIALFIWCIGVQFTGLSWNFWSLVVSRGVTGMGTGGIIPIVPPCILVICPKEKVTQWIGLFFIFAPIGSAVGFLYEEAFLISTGHWYWSFRSLSFLALLLIFVGLILYKNPELKRNVSDSNFWTETKAIFMNPLFDTLLLSNCAVSFAGGGVFYWLTYYLISYFDLSASITTVYLFFFALITGTISVFIGSFALDKSVEKYLNRNENTALSKDIITEWAASREIFLVEILVFVFFVAAGFSTEVWVYIVLNSIGMFFLLTLLGPLNSSILLALPEKLRILGSSYHALLSNLLGDALSPLLIGMVADQYGIHLGMIVLGFWMIFARVFGGLAWRISEFKGAPTKYILENFCNRKIRFTDETSNESIISQET